MVKTNFEKYLGGFTGAQAFFIIAISILILFLWKITTPVPNYDNETNTVYYTEGDPIPPNYVSNGYVLIFFMLLGGLVMSFITKESKTNLISIEEARSIVETYLKNRKSIMTKKGQLIEIGDYHVSEDFIAVRYREKSEEKIDRYVLQVIITDDVGNDRYIKCNIHPYNRNIIGFVESDEPLSDIDKCSKCGKEYDFKPIDTEDLKQFKKIKEGLKD